MTILEEVYCIPKTVEEWKLLGYGKPLEETYVVSIEGVDIPIFEGDSDFGYIVDNGKEITVQHFHDLLNDKIVDWRLEEIGFVSGISYDKLKISEIIEVIVDNQGGVQLCTDKVCSDTLNIKTFTELKQLIKFLK